MNVRQPAVAGTFYPAEPRELRHMLGRYLFDAGEERRPARGIMVPHAGYVYSGKTAGEVYSRTLLPSRILILGPNHTGEGAQLSLYPAGRWATPLGEAEVDGALVEEILSACPGVRLDETSHRHEHAIEVQIPFLQEAEPGFRFAALTVGLYEYAGLEALGRGLATAIRDSASEEGEPLLAVSSDMTHYEEAGSARLKDRRAIDCMERLDGEGLFRAVHKHGISMCGFAPAVAAMAALRELGATRGELLSYTNSGEASGDYQRVVAYAGMRFN